MELERARAIAESVMALLAPACERIAIAGSIRREKADVGDIEIVALPIPGVNLLGEPAGNRLNATIEAAMAREPRLVWDDAKKRAGPKYKRFWWTGGISSRSGRASAARLPSNTRSNGAAKWTRRAKR